MQRGNLVVLVASKTATSPPSANHAKTSSSASLQPGKVQLHHTQNIHLFLDSHSFKIAVVKELVITVQPFSAFLGPLDGPKKIPYCYWETGQVMYLTLL